MTGKIAVICIILLFLVVVLFIFVHLYAKRFLWGIEEPPLPTRRGRHRLHHGLPLVFTLAEESTRVGFDPSVLRSLPVMIFDPEDFEDGLDCAVCLSEVEPGEKARLLLNCKHGFHVDCIDMRFKSHSTCPFCRNPVASQNRGNFCFVCAFDRFSKHSNQCLVLGRPGSSKQ